MRRVYNMKKTLSMRQFITELGGTFSEHIIKRLLELGDRCVLTRKDNNYIFDLKHIEHTQFECACTTDDNISKKEYSYGQFIVADENLYFSEVCAETSSVMQSDVVSSVYNNLDSQGAIYNEDRNAKKIDDSNIDYIVNSILKVCPPVSQAHLDMVQGMISRQENK